MFPESSSVDSKIAMNKEYNQRRQRNRNVEIAKYAASAILVASGVAAVWALSHLAEKPATQSSDVLITQVDVDPVNRFFGTLDLTVPGSVVPHREIRIASEVTGKILTKYPEFQAGTFVTAGTKLAEIDSQDYQADSNILQADLEQAEARVAENQRQIEGEQRSVELAKADFEIQQRDFERTLRIASALSRSEVDRARQALNASKTNLTTRTNALELLEAARARLEAAVTVARNRLQQSKTNLGRVTIFAPADGVIVKEMVEENDFVTVGTQLAIFEDTAIAEVRCNLTTSELEWVRKNSRPTGDNAEKSDDPVDPRMTAYQIPQTEVTIFDAADPEIKWQGTLSRFDGIGRDEMTKTIPCRIIIPKPIVDTKYGPRALVRNMYVKCRIEVETSSSDAVRDLLFFDELAIQPGNLVWKVVDGRLEKARVEVVDRTEKMIEGERKGLIVARAIDGSLKPDDSVVVSPLSQPTNGAKVMVTKKESRDDAMTDTEEASAGADSPVKERSPSQTSERSTGAKAEIKSENKADRNPLNPATKVR